jgi:hypothetical protein
MQWLGLLQRFQKKVTYACGIGVVTSAGVYLKLTGKTLVLGGVVKRLGLIGKMPLPLEVVHSGKTTRMLLGLLLSNVSMSTNFAFSGGFTFGCVNDRQTAVKRDIGSTSLVVG